jgi:hypothetical protein
MIDINKLEKVKHQSSGRIVARCPACAEDGSDKTGNHFFMSQDGKFGCCIYSGPEGKDHRKRIFALVGIKDSNLGTLGTPFPNPYAYGKKKYSIHVRSSKNPSQASQAKSYNRNMQEIDAETGFPIIDGAICPF